MPWSGSPAVYTRAYPSWTNDANNNLPISATKFDLEDNDFATGINQSVNVSGSNGYWKQTSQEQSLSITPTSFLFPPLDIRRYGADPTGVADSTAAITNAIAVAVALGGGVVVFGVGGKYTVSSTLTQESGVILDGMNSTLTYTGAAIAITSPTSGALNYAQVLRLILSAASATTLLSLISGYNCVYRDLQFLSNSTTNTVISLTANTVGTANPQGNLNCVQNGFENISFNPTVGGSGCGTFIFLSGNSGSQGIVTDNQFLNLQAQSVNVYGVNFAQWCDSNVFTGMTRIALNGLISPANGIGVVFASVAAQGGVYSEFFEQLAIDNFAIPAVDNRQGVVCSNLLSTKNIAIMALEVGPQNEQNAANNIAGLLSGIINIAPRTSSNYQTLDFLGTNLGVGIGGLPQSTITAASGPWMSGASQYVNFVSGAVVNFGAPTLGVSYGCQPNAASSVGAYTVPQVMGFATFAGSAGTNAIVTNSYGFYCADQNYAGTNYGFYTNMVAGAGKWAYYSASTAASQLGGPLTASFLAIPAGGTAGQGLMVSNTANFGVFFGSGVPTLSAAKGSLYLRSDGSSISTRLYVNTDGGTTWTNFVTAA